jgi:hypothetical protein
MANNVIKVGTADDSLSIQQGPFAMGASGLGDYGPTSRTNYYAGINVPEGGYTFYRLDGGGNITANVAHDDEQAMFFLRSYGATGTTLSEMFAWASASGSVIGLDGDITTSEIIQSVTGSTSGTSGTSGTGGSSGSSGSGGTSGTSGSGVTIGITPTVFVQSYWINAEDACSTTTYGSLLFYSTSTYLSTGSFVFTDAALTIPVTPGFVIANGFVKLIVRSGGYLEIYECPTAFVVQYWDNIVDPCIGSQPQGSLTVYSTSSYLQTGDFVFYDAALTQPVMGRVISGNNAPLSQTLSGGYLQLINCGNAVSSEIASLTTNSGTVCTDTSIGFYANFETSNMSLCNASTIYANIFSSYVGTTVYVKSQQTNQSVAFSVTSPNRAIRTSNCTNCPTYSQIVRLSDVSTTDACTNTGNPTIEVFSSKPYGQATNGDSLYYNSNLTNIVYTPYVAFTGLGIVFHNFNGRLDNQASC